MQELLDLGIEGMVGLESSGEAIELFDFLVENELVAVSPSATSAELTIRNRELVNNDETPYFFRTVANDIYQAQLLVDQIQRQSSSVNLLIVAQQGDYANNLISRIRNRITIATDNIVRYRNQNIQNLINRIEALNGIGSVTSIVVISGLDDGGSIIRGMLDSETIPDTAQYYRNGFTCGRESTSISRS